MENEERLKDIELKIDMVLAILLKDDYAWEMIEKRVEERVKELEKKV